MFCVCGVCVLVFIDDGVVMMCDVDVFEEIIFQCLCVLSEDDDGVSDDDGDDDDGVLGIFFFLFVCDVVVIGC